MQATTFIFLLVTSALSWASAGHAADLSVSTINGANPLEGASEGEQSPGYVRLQTLLDRAGASPVVIDGYPGQNTTKAIGAFERMNGMDVDGELDEKVWEKLTTEDGEPVARRYTLTEEDVSIKLVDIPDSPTGAQLAEYDCLCYERHSEAIAEEFHMDEDLLKAMNPDVDFSKAGTEISVLEPGRPVDATVSRIEVDKAQEMVFAFDDADKLVFAARATIGSENTPSPSGQMKVEAVAPQPTYTWNAKKNLGGDSDETYSIAAGPNGPVGGTWIDLSKPTYGIHGTPDPAKIGRSESHGCVRLTNWDVEALSKMVKPGETTVEFLGG